MGIDFDPLAGLKTDDLKAELARLREELVGRQSVYAEKMISLDSSVNDLKKMEEKATFVVTQLEQIAVMTTPPPKSGAEGASDALDRYFSDPVFLASSGLGAVGGVIVLSGPLLKLVGMAPKLGKAAKLANSTKFMKVLKLGRGALLLGAAIAIVELAVGMFTAQEINKQLRKDRAELEKLMKEADAEIAKLDKASAEAKALIKKLLTDADLSEMAHGDAMNAYVRMMNDAIGALSAQKAKGRMVRKMVMHGMMEVDDIVSITGVDISVVESISQRVAVERALVEGKTILQAARGSGLEAEQIVEIENVVRARNEAVAGEDPSSVSALLGVPISVVQSEGEETLPLLAPFWEKIENEEDLEEIGPKVLVSGEALLRLNKELRAKTALARGDDPSVVADAAGRSIEHVAEWGADVTEGRVQVAILRRDGKLGKPAMTAAQHRLPLSLAA